MKVLVLGLVWMGMAAAFNTNPSGMTLNKQGVVIEQRRCACANSQDGTSSTGNCKKKEVKDCTPGPPTCTQNLQLDIALLLDKSGSIGSDNFVLMQNFGVDLVDSFSVGTGLNQTAFAVACFASDDDGRRFYEFDADQQAGLVGDAIRSIPYVATRTDITEGLQLSEEQFERSRPNADFPNVLILLTDGVHNEDDSDDEDPEDVADRLRMNGVFIVVLPIGPSANTDTALEQFASIAGPDGEGLVIPVTDFNALQTQLGSITAEICEMMAQSS